MNDEKINPFDVLEVAPGASRHEIDRAYELALLSFGEDSLASYSLYSPRERMTMIHRIERAYRALTDPGVAREEAPPASDLASILRDVDRAERRPEPEAPSAAARAIAGPAEDRLPAARGRASLNRHKPLVAGPAVVPADIPGPYDGPALRKIREDRGLTLEEVAASTKIGLTHLRLIESNTYDRLPAQVYLRGYLLAYARCLRLDPRAVAAGYLEQAQAVRSGNGHHA